jgi:hypothetical protein
VLYEQGKARSVEEFIFFEIFTADRMYLDFGYEPEEIIAANIRFGNEKSLNPLRVKILDETKRMVPMSQFPGIILS